MPSDRLSVGERIAGAIGVGAKTIQDGKMTLAVLQFVYMVIFIVFRSNAYEFDFYKGPQTGWRNNVQMCNDAVVYSTNDASRVCFQTQVAYRVSWAVTFLFLILTILAAVGMGVLALRGLFLVKFLLPIAMFFFFIFLWPDVFFTWMAYVGGFFSIVAWIYLFIMVVNLASKIDNALKPKASTGKTPSPVSIGLGFLFFAASVIGTVFLALNTVLDQRPDPSKIRDRRWLTIGTCIFMFICLVISVLPVVAEHGSFLVSAVMMALMTTLCWGATLNNYEDINAPSGMMFHTHIAYLIILVLWFTAAIFTASLENTGVEKVTGEIHSLIDDVEIRKADKVQVKKMNTVLYLLFHACIPFALMTVLYQERVENMENDLQFWVYTVAIIHGGIFYLWYLLKPMCLPKTYYSIEANQAE